MGSPRGYPGSLVISLIDNLISNLLNALLWICSFPACPLLGSHKMVCVLLLQVQIVLSGVQTECTVMLLQYNDYKLARLEDLVKWG